MDEKYSTARKRALAFLKKPADKQEYSEALAILRDAGYKPIFIAKLYKAGENQDTRRAAFSNICSMIRQWAKPEDPIHEDEVPSASVDEPSAEDVEKMQLIMKDNTTPIGGVIRTFADCYKIRAKLHSRLSAVGEKNDPESVAKRKELVTSIAALSDRMDALYPMIAEFQASGVQPSIEEVNSPLNNSHLQSKPSADSPSVTDSESAPISSMSLVQLKIYKKNLATRIRRTLNKIEYRQENIADAKPNPLPEGSPKRVRLEVRVKKYREEMEQVEMAIAKFG